MDKIKYIVVQWIITTLLVVISATPNIAAVYVDADYSSRVSKNQLEERLQNIPSSVSLKYTEEVHELVDTYIRSFRKGSERILGKTNVFFPLFDLELDKRAHLPREIKHLAIIESGLDVHALSRSGAVGLWQFMPETGKLQGLSINSQVDERKDAYQSTKAAYKYLEYLHNEFDDWTLALAAYNCGPGNVRKAIRKSQSTDFWVLEKFLPKETRRYIPKFIAASYLMEYYDNHNLTPRVTPAASEKTAIARIYDYVSFGKLSQATGVSVSTIRELNPAFKGKYIPKSEDGYLLTLPEAEMFTYLTNNNLMDNLEFTLSNPKESFERTIIFTGFQLRKAELEMYNNMPSIESIVTNPLNQYLVPQELPVESDDNGLYNYYELELGESIKDLVARIENTTLEEIVNLNKIDLRDPPRPGDMIKIKK